MNTDPLQEGLRQLARETRPTKPLPNAEQLWWKAEVIRRLVSQDEAVRQAERPILWSHAAALLLVLVCPLAFFVSQEPRFLAILLALGMTPLTVLFAWFFLRTET